MGKKNYNEISKKTENTEVVDTVEEAVEETTEETVEDVLVEKKEPKIIKGVVDHCEQLRVRKEPSTTSDIVKIITKGAKVKVNLDESTDDFYKVQDGFCMKKFITLQ